MAESRTIKIIERDGDTVRIVGQGPEGRIEVICTMHREGDTILLRGLHADGAGPTSLGLIAIREFAREFARQQGARVIEIYGGRRTSGARPGKVPRPVRITAEEEPI
jgi:hypothetical protein